MNPYKVLGVETTATQAEIKTAYRNLVKKYHPDRYVNNPLSDLAQEKMREINQAYDMLEGKAGTGTAKQKSNGYSYDNRDYSSSQSYSGNAYGNVSYLHIRQLINSRRIDEAMAQLAKIKVHNAEWNYLMATCYSWKGLYAQANHHFNVACQMDPTNMEYARSANNMNNTNRHYTQQSSNMGGGASACDICSCLICSDCCCECMGGDLIGCC